MPAQLSDRGSDARRSAAIRTLAVDDQTRQVVAALDARGVPSLLLKGPAIARSLYDPDESRFYTDTDLLVAPGALAEAEAALRELGYARDYEERSLALTLPHAAAWRRPGSLVSVDLHYTLSGVGCDPEQLWRVLSEHTAGLELHGTGIRALDVPGLALQVALHAAHHGVAWHKPRQDLQRALQRLDLGQWRAAAALAERVDALDAFGTGLRMMPPGESVAAQLGLTPNRSREVQLRAMAAPTVAVALERVCAKAGPAAKARQLALWLFPPKDLMQGRGPLARSGRTGLWLAYGMRICGAARQAVPAARAWRRATRATRARGS